MKLKSRCGAKILVDLLTVVARAVTVIVVVVIIITLASFQGYCCCCCLRALFIFSLPVPMILRNIRYEFSVDPDEIEPPVDAGQPLRLYDFLTSSFSTRSTCEIKFSATMANPYFVSCYFWHPQIVQVGQRDYQWIKVF